MRYFSCRDLLSGNISSLKVGDRIVGIGFVQTEREAQLIKDLCKTIKNCHDKTWSKNIKRKRRGCYEY